MYYNFTYFFFEFQQKTKVKQHQLKQKMLKMAKYNRRGVLEKGNHDDHLYFCTIFIVMIG